MTTVNANTNNSNVLDKNTLVLINGLQSEAGQKLNGGIGILIASEKEGRCPVRIFALKDGDGFKVMETVQDKKLKTINVSAFDSDAAKEAFEEANVKHLDEAQASGDPKATLFWLATSYKLLPEAYNYALWYANALSVVEHKHKEAAAIMQKTLQEQDITSDPRYPKFYEQIVKTCCDAREYLDLALKCALEIPTDTPENKTISRDCLETLVNTCKPILGKARGIGVDDLAQWNVQASQKLLDHDPDHAILLEVVAGSYCLAGDNLEGAKLYRQAIAQGAPLAKIREMLIMAQMQCPGMPLDSDKFHLLYKDGTTCYCVHNSEKANVRIGQRSDGTFSVEPVANQKLNVIQLENILPEDPNDPSVFSAEFLEQVHFES